MAKISKVKVTLGYDRWDCMDVVQRSFQERAKSDFDDAWDNATHEERNELKDRLNQALIDVLGWEFVETAGVVPPTGK